MDGIHDLGGKPGYGAVEKRDTDKVFQDRWEAAVFAMVGAGVGAGAWSNTDRFRHAVERIHPQAYLTQGYYGRWLGGVETLLVEAGIFSQREISDRALALGAAEDDLIAARPRQKPDPLGPKPIASGSIRPIAGVPEFSPGDSVHTKAAPVAGHTRLPEYARGKCGEILAIHDGWIFPDTNAHGLGEQPKYLYTVRFTSEELWQRAGFSVNLDLFEPYLSLNDNEDEAS